MTPASPKPRPPSFAFTRFLRAGAFGRRGSPLACKRIREAAREVAKAFKADPCRGAEGMLLLAQKIVPAIERVDSSSGALGNATSRTWEKLIELAAQAELDLEYRRQWLAKLWDAVEEDAYGFLAELYLQWGSVCREPVLLEEEVRACEDLMRFLEQESQKGGFIFAKKEYAFFDCLMALGRYPEVVERVNAMDKPDSFFQEKRIHALVALGQSEEALRRASAFDDRLLESNRAERLSEQILLQEGKRREAFDRFAAESVLAPGKPYLRSYRELAAKYPEKSSQELLTKLVHSMPGEEGKWFATAKSLGLYREALFLVQQSPADPHTLLRAVRDFRQREPEFAMGCALAAVRWISLGHGYEISWGDIRYGAAEALDIAVRLGKRDAVLTELKEYAENLPEVAGLHRLLRG